MLALRSATGQPLWSGGASSGAAGTDASATHGGQGGATGQVQVAPEDWETLAATVVAVNRNGLTIETAAGEVLALTFGNARFWQEQAVQFTAGDAVEVKGFWQDGQFQTGQVTNTTTGERLLLRDPNGRPLWGGPGRQGGQQRSAEQWITIGSRKGAKTLRKSILSVFAPLREVFLRMRCSTDRGVTDEQRS
ncbi:MAG: hypothetical protein V9G19_10900 [Tetrasphaera sp.]